MEQEHIDTSIVDVENANHDNETQEAPSGWKHYFSFEGRIGRLEYFLSYIAITFYAYLEELFPGEYDDISAGDWLFMLIWLILLVPMFWFLFAQGAKRCHDIGVSGWFQLIPFYYLWLFIAEGDAESNKYGLPV